MKLISWVVVVALATWGESLEAVVHLDAKGKEFLNSESGDALDDDTQLNDLSAAIGADNRPVLTLLVGTHSTPAMETLRPSSQSPACQMVNAQLRNMWTLFAETGKYGKSRKELARALQALQPRESCTLSSTPKGYLYTFPLTISSKMKCTTATRNILLNKKYMLGQNSDEARSRIVVPWFLLKPDLVTLDVIARLTNVKLRYLVTIGHDPHTAAISQEGCPRFSTILNKRDIYKQRLLQVALFDLHHQLSKVTYADVVVNICDDSKKVQELLGADFDTGKLKFGSRSSELKNIRFLDRHTFNQAELSCPKSEEYTLSLLRNSHFPSMLASDFFKGRQLQKAVYSSPSNKIAKLIFVAGVEGSGHHLWSVLGRKHTTKKLYDAFTEYLTVSAWRDDSWEAFGVARNALVEVIRELNTQTVPEDGSKVFFLNTVMAGAAVNMYSYPWGGPRCYLKRFARVVCNIDLLDIARIVEEAGVDFRVIVLKRTLGAAIVSSSINRNFGSFVSQTRMLGLSWSLLRTSLSTLDKKFFQSYFYEDLIQKPIDSTLKIAKQLDLDLNSALVRHFNKTLLESNAQFGEKNVHSWKKKIDRNQFEFMSDLLFYNEEQRKEFDNV